jgi:hypothetical protein
MAEEFINCSICGKPIHPSYSNNAEPINSGRCCSHCNFTIVVPARILAAKLHEEDTNMIDIYIAHGYQNRGDYIRSLVEDYGVEEEVVWALADVLGPAEDFDALVSSVEDIADGAF